MKITIVAVGKLKESYWTKAIAEYAKRISRFSEFKIIETDEKRNVVEEGREILKKLSGFVIVTDIEGSQRSSTEIAQLFQDCFNAGKSQITFVIGGSEGLSEEVKQRAAVKLSFGRATYPHQLMRVILSEQVYRAFTILNRLTYHK